MNSKEIADILIKAFKKGRKVLVIGNGGSATMASHFTGELLGKYQKERQPLPAIALNDIASLTAIANDLGYTFVFRRQVEAIGKKGDVLITLTTSGKSPNILWAEDKAEEMGMIVIRFPINNPWRGTPKTQELHLKMIHTICGFVEDAFI